MMAPPGTVGITPCSTSPQLGFTTNMVTQNTTAITLTQTVSSFSSHLMAF